MCARTTIVFSGRNRSLVRILELGCNVVFPCAAQNIRPSDLMRLGVIGFPVPVGARDKISLDLALSQAKKSRDLLGLLTYSPKERIRMRSANSLSTIT
jgi:hypothetical protein